MLTDSEPSSGWSGDNLAVVVDAVVGLRASLTREDQERLPAASTHVAQCLRAWSERDASGVPAPKTLGSFARWWMRDAFADALWDPENPFRSEYIRQQATAAARTALAQFADKYSADVAEVEAAPSVAAESLARLAKEQLDRPREIRSFWSYFRTMVRRAVGHETRKRINQMQPGETARWRLFCEYRDELAKTRPKLADRDVRDIAWQRTEETIAKTRGFIARFDSDLVYELLPDLSDLLGSAEGRVLVEQIDRLVKPPFFNENDRLSWRLFLAADLRGAAIDWRAVDVKPKVGAQRLYAFFKKLAKIVQDWR